MIAILYFTDCVPLVFQILSYLQQEKRLGQPKSCPDWLYEMILECWAFNTQDRLKCQDIEDRIKEKICL